MTAIAPIPATHCHLCAVGCPDEPGCRDGNCSCHPSALASVLFAPVPSGFTDGTSIDLAEYWRQEALDQKERAERAEGTAEINGITVRELAKKLTRQWATVLAAAICAGEFPRRVCGGCKEADCNGEPCGYATDVAVPTKIRNLLGDR